MEIGESDTNKLSANIVKILQTRQQTVHFFVKCVLAAAFRDRLRCSDGESDRAGMRAEGNGLSAGGQPENLPRAGLGLAAGSNKKAQ